MVGQRAPKKAAVKVPAQPKKYLAHNPTSRIVATPKAAFIARAVNSIHSWLFPD